MSIQLGIYTIGALIIAIGYFIPISNNYTTARVNNTAAATIYVATPAQTEWYDSLKPPADYDGNPEQYDDFIKECETYLRLCRVTDYKDQIDFALSIIRGGNNNLATVWSHNIRADMLEYEHRTPPECPFANWEEFKASFLRHFGSYTSRDDVLEKITTIKQGNMTCQEYVTVFKAHLIRSGFNDAAGLFFFKKGLNKGLWNKLETTFPLPEENADGTTNIQNWINRAVALDRQYRRWKHDRTR
ncbi:hypothetical protein CVT25_015310 [Psilocybe cyanescens]|uniref:Retrotransposon gag domain-containing protein n=1 Tax=Psilocybe cyanescens TaxID=93625 RepID=A0A409WH17_PSICY|nr:hypothetical protein CVT25_015310 [Psilocybe cyanescens]